MTTSPARARRVLAAAVASLAVVVLAPGTPAQAFSSSNSVRLDAVEARLVSLINNARTSRGIPALVVATGTTDVARRWSARQASRNVLEHNPNVARDVQAAGSPDWGAIGENIARGRNADAIFTAYMNSSTHRGNILEPRYRFLGIGWAERADGYGYNTQVFVDRYTSSYGSTREPAFGGLADRRAITANYPFANFESGADSRGMTMPTTSGIAVSRFAVQPAATGDQAAVFTVRETQSGTGGQGEMRMRDALDLAQARSVAIRMTASTPTKKAVVVDVYLKRNFSDTVLLGSVTLAHGVQKSAALTIPASARNFRNELVVAVRRSALAAVSTSLASRYATINVHGITIVV